MEEALPQTILGNGPPPGSSCSVAVTHNPPLTAPAVPLQFGETLVVPHPHSQSPMRIVPTTKLHSPYERTVLHNIKTAEASYAPFPTRADFEQAEIFVNNNCSNKLIDDQLKFSRQNGMHINMKSSHEMHKLLARGVEEDITNDSKVGSVCDIQACHAPHASSLSFIRRKSRSHMSKVNLTKSEHTWFATVLQWMQYSALLRILICKGF